MKEKGTPSRFSTLFAKVELFRGYQVKKAFGTSLPKFYPRHTADINPR
jgi:hypothetical protein